MAGIATEVFGQWNRKIVDIGALSDTDQIPECLVTTLNLLIESDQRLIVVFGQNSIPVKVYDSAIGYWPPEDLANYMQGAYLLDPFYRAGISGIGAGLYRLADVAPAGFRESEYFRTYYEASGIEDEVGFITCLPGGFFANISFTRLQGSGKFSKECIEHLRLGLPVAEAFMANYWQHSAAARQESGSELYVQLETAMKIFAASVLTPREAEVMRMYLYGHETKSIAERLNISTHTVSMHRKNSYAKLDISSQAELFSLFISSMYCFTGEPTIDPLDTYLNTISGA